MPACAEIAREWHRYPRVARAREAKVARREDIKRQWRKAQGLREQQLDREKPQNVYASRFCSSFLQVALKDVILVLFPFPTATTRSTCFLSTLYIEIASEKRQIYSCSICFSARVNRRAEVGQLCAGFERRRCSETEKRGEGEMRAHLRCVRWSGAPTHKHSLGCSGGDHGGAEYAQSRSAGGGSLTVSRTRSGGTEWVQVPGRRSGCNPKSPAGPSGRYDHVRCRGGVRASVREPVSESRMGGSRGGQDRCSGKRGWVSVRPLVPEEPLSWH